MKDKDRYLRPDSKGRIALGKLAEGVSCYKCEINEEGYIILIPQVEIPENEVWLYQNKDVLSKVQNGIANSSRKQTQKLESFAKYANDNLE